MSKTLSAALARITTILLVIAGLGATFAYAEPAPIIDFTGGLAEGIFGGQNGTAGFSFEVTEATTISGLGFFDVGSNGLINSHQVGLWTSTGTLLASAILDNSSNVVASTSSLGDWRETNITSLTLDPGSYVLGAFFRNVQADTEDEAALDASGTSSASGISYGNAAFGSGSFTFPGSNDPAFDAGIFGPMAFTGSTSAMPEPGSLGLCACALLLCGLVLRLRWRQSSR